jgi:hypothetical protein
MFSLLTKIPVKNRKSISDGLRYATVIAGSIGLISVLAYSEVTKEKCSGHLWWKDCVDFEVPMSSRLTYLVVGVFLLGVAALCAISALCLATMSGDLKQYEAVLAGVETRRIQEIADITGLPATRVRRDLQSMIKSEMITDFYIDYGADRVVSTKFVPKTSHKTVVKCSECGGNNELIVGITRSCGFCGQPLLMGTK